MKRNKKQRRIELLDCDSEISLEELIEQYKKSQSKQDADLEWDNIVKVYESNS